MCRAILHSAFRILHSCAGATDDRNDARARARARPSLPPASLRGPRTAARGLHAGDVVLPHDGDLLLRRRSLRGLGLLVGAAWHWKEVPELAPKVQLFMTFYWGMTGLHALHMVIGVGLLIWILWRAARGHFGPEYYSPVEVMGLYWHFVDIVWIFLFPFLYLIH